MKFSNIPGQFRIKNELISMADKDRLPHAILLTGPKGNGKLALALAFSSYIQCRSKDGKDLCGICPACKKANKMMHPDIGFVLPNIASEVKNIAPPELMATWRKTVMENPFLEPEDWIENLTNESKNANINKEAIKSVLDFFTYSIFEGNKKIMIIWNAELMAAEANRLLKLIEEPPKDSVIILVAEDTTKILKTILSRCQTFRIPPFSDEELEDWILEKMPEDKSLITQLIKISEGDINKLIKLSKFELTDFFELLVKWLNVTYVATAEKISSFAEEFSRLTKDNQKQFLIYTLSFLEQVIKSFFSDTKKVRLDDKEQDLMNKLKNIMNHSKLVSFSEEVNKNVYFIERNANTKLLIFETTLKLNKILRN